MTEEELNLISHYRAPLPSLGKEVEGFVIDEVNGERVESPKCVLSQGGATAALGLSGGGSTGFKRSLSSVGLNPHLSPDLVQKIENPLPVRYVSARSKVPILGYEVETFISALEAVVRAYMMERLPSSLNKLAIKANALRDIFARTALDSMIYQESGYWQAREGEKIIQILDNHLLDYARKWSKTFPDEFWKLLIKIKGYPSYIALDRPAYVGHWVNDIVYARLAPKIKEELTKLNPRVPETGSRQHKHHQFLTEDEGIPALKDHIISVMTLMKAAQNETDFNRMLDRAMPKWGKSIPFDL